jgi:ABC-type hemin transport system substrate-binding protein
VDWLPRRFLTVTAWLTAAGALAKDAKPPLRIVSLYTADTEILLRLEARDSLVGI